MAGRPATIKDRARGPTHSMPPRFPVNNRKKQRTEDNLAPVGFPVSYRMTTGNERDRRPMGSVPLAVDNRTKQDE
jgi:hypothetical protein